MVGGSGSPENRLRRESRRSGHGEPGRTGETPYTSGRSIGGFSSVAPPARNSWAGRPP